MLSDADVQALVGAHHSDPFAALGLHADAHGKLWLRALLPGAQQVQVLEARSGKPVAGLALRHPQGLFEGALGRRRKRFDYRLEVRWLDAAAPAANIYADAYAFGAQLTDDDLTALQEGKHPDPYTVLGALCLEHQGVAGVRFALWAPNARRVSVVGDFNHWDARRHPMRLRHGAGVWEIFVPHAGLGDHYKFELLGPTGQLLPQKADPYARAAELRPGTASIVAPMPEKKVLPAERAQANARSAPISIYEVHAASWRRGADGRFASWDELAQTLPAYVAEQGFTHVELLPVSEHPFDGSWGYQTLGLFALSARFGPPEGFERLLQACHARGIGVLLDWVPAHFPADAHGLAQFDGTALYEYADPREGFHNDWNTLIYNFGRKEVRNFLAASAHYWTRRLGVDGLRVDAVASMLYRDYSRRPGQWIANVDGGRENLEAISLLRRINQEVAAVAPGAIMVAEESTTFPGVSAPTGAGGLGFHYKWNMGWMNDTLQYMREDPVHRRWHHAKMSFSIHYAFSENFVLPLSHDEVVHGKGSLLGKMPGDDWQRFANLRAYYGFMWGHPGKKLLFMGQEFAQPGEWDHDAQLPWALLQDERHAGVQRLVRDLNHLYRAQSALHQLDCEARGFEWLVADDAQMSVFAWLRRDAQDAMLMVVSNLTPLPRQDYDVGVPHGPSQWREVLNTDSACYGGSNQGNGAARLPTQAAPAHGRAHSLRLTLPPLATIFLVPA
ncbi:MAG: 1,4-alpha-glucan branching protein GlgB [Rhodoferax sp.]|uniref:1,4-alpha-glucan branching protein GlgB n=1 Tax=Rhodoferax sp. TaxID=50421 RepID=UPI002634E26C|nr:1,4-alpha-glucan branching protein GlgB [Rhodoferax sp.]MDD5335682.1 1,4-alpha-glucan branching protein GlgB [Rhodoferax sp.]